MPTNERIDSDNVRLTSLPPLALGGLDARSFHLIIFPTEGCNFRCTYCYEDFELGTMKPGVVSGIKALVSNRIPELDSLRISWFGGEPLLARSVVRDISSHIIRQTKHRSDFSYNAHMTTNGFFLDFDCAREMSRLGVSLYQISIDGDEAIHDKTRVSASRTGTFSQIWKNLLSIHESALPIEILLRVHFSSDTWQFLDPLIDKLNDAFSADPRFKIYFKPIERLGGPNDGSVKELSEAEKGQIKETLYGKLKNQNQRRDALKDQQYVCYAAKPNSLAIRADGQIAKCTVALHDKANSIGKLNPDGSMNINQELYRVWLQGYETLDKTMLACPYRALKNASPSAASLT